MKLETLNVYDDLEKRCPLLGHQVKFNYCRIMNNAIPCQKVFDCWFQQFDIEKFITNHFSEQDLQKILTPPKPKIVSLLELIERAKSTIEKNPENDAK